MPELRFESIETDESNKFAVALLKAVVRLEKGYSPLLIHGEQGCGKTHLLSVFNTELALAHPEVSVLYIPDDFPIETFPFGEETDGGADAFLYKAYSSRDFLIVDDIERFENERKACERFYALFDTFVDNAKQVVLTSSLPIENLQSFSDRFLSRLRGGIDTPLSPPQPESRLKILKRECMNTGLTLGVDILQILMLEAGNDIEYLKKLPGHLKIFAAIEGQSPNKEKVEEFLSIIRSEVAGDKRNATSEQIYATWVQSQASKREAKITARIEELEQELSSQSNIASKLKDELESVRSQDRKQEDDTPVVAGQLEQLKKELEEKDTLLRSQETIISSEIASLTKSVEERDKLTEQLKTDYEKTLAEKDAKIFELEKMLEGVSEKLSASGGEKKAAEAKTEKLVSQLEQLAKKKEDEILSLKIQIEDNDRKLELLREEREMRTAQYEKENAEFQEQTAELQNQNLLLKKENDDLNELVGELQAQLKQDSAELAETAKLQSAEIKQREALLKELEEAKLKMQDEAERVADEMRQKTDRERELTSDLQARQNELETIKADVEEQRAHWQSQIDLIQEKLRQTEQIASENEAKLGLEIEQRKTLENEIVSKTASLEELKESNEAQLRQIDKILSERDEFKESADALGSEIEAVKRAIEERDATLSGKNAELDGLKSRIDDLKNNLEEREALLAETRENEAKQRRNLQEELDRRTAEMKRIGSELVDEKLKLREKNEQIEKLNVELSKASQGISGLREEKSKSEKESASKIEEYSKKLDSTENRLAERETELAEHEARSLELSQELDKTRKTFAGQIEAERAKWTEKEKSLSESNVSLKAELEQARKNTEKLKAGVSALENEIKRRESVLVAMEKDESKKISQLKDELKRRDAELKRLSRELAERDKGVETGSKTIATLNEKMHALEGNLAKITNEKQELEQKLSLSIDNFEGKVKEGESQVAQLRSELEEGQIRISDAQEQLNKERASHAELIEKEKAEASRREGEIRQNNSLLEEKLQESSEKILGLKKKVEIAEQRLQEQEVILNQEREDVSRSARLVEEKDNRIIELQKEMDSIREDFLRQTAEGAEARDSFSSLEAELSEKGKALSAMRLESSELQESYRKLETEYKEKERQIERLESEKISEQQKIDSQQKKIEKLEALMSELAKDEGDSEESLLSRISELEKTIAEKDKTIESQTVKMREQLDTTVTSKDEEISRLKSEYEKHDHSLKDQVRDATKELLSVRENAEKQVMESRKEVETLRDKISQMETHIAAIEAEQKMEKLVTSESISDDAQISEPEISEEMEAPEERADLPEETHTQVSEIEWLNTFEDFVVSEANTFFITMSEKVARSPGELYNPLCIYGPEYSGKTHILHAVGKLATSEHPDLTCQLITVASLLDIMQTTPKIIDEWLETVDIMIVDDFEIVDISSDLQLKLYSFFNGLAERQAQIVIASKQPPIRMSHLEEYFLRFLESGLLAKLEPNQDVLEKYKEAAEAIAFVAKESALVRESLPEEEESTGQPQSGEQEAVTEEKKDFMAELLAPNPRLTSADFRGKRILDEVEEAFKNPGKKRRNKFPLLVIEDDSERREHFFHAIANKLQEIFGGSAVALLSLNKLAEMLAKDPSFEWKELLIKFKQSKAVLINDCESVVRLPDSAKGYLRTVLEKISQNDILLMFGSSKEYKKEPVFGTLHKKASRKKI